MMFHRRLFWLSTIALLVFCILPVSNLIARSSTHNLTMAIEDPQNFWSFDGAEGLIALGLWKCCGLSFNPQQVIIGKSGYLFIGNRYNQVLDQVTGTKTPDANAAATWVANLKGIQEHLSKKRAAFLFVLAPNKHTIYPEFLPSDVVPAPVSVADIFAEKLQQSGVTFYDARQELLNLKKTSQAYRKTDTHWTSLGAAITYAATLRALQFQIDGLAPLSFASEEIRREAGDQARMLKLSDLLGEEHDTDFDMTFENTVQCMGVTPFIGPVGDVCSGPQIASFIRDQITTTVAPQAPNPQVALLICDSFCTAHLDLYQNTFRTVHRVHWQHLQGHDLEQQFERLSPDLVIYQLVERDLMRPDLTLH